MIRGEIWIVDFGIPIGSAAGYRRPAVVLQNNIFNKSNIQTSIVVPLTSNLRLADYSPNVLIPKNKTGLPKDSVAIIPLVTAIDKSSFLEKISDLPASFMQEICKGIIEVLNLA